MARSLVPLPFAALLVPLGIGSGFVLAFRARSGRAYLIAGMALLACALGMLRAAVAPQALPAPFVPLLGTSPTLTGTVAANPDVREANERITLKIAKSGATTRIIAVVPRTFSAAYGETLSVSGPLAAPAPFDSDGGRVFRYDQYLSKDGVFAVMSPAHAAIVAAPKGIRTHIIGALYGLTRRFAQGLEASLPEPEAGLAQGLVTGGKQQLSKALLAAFTAAGIVQIVVLSGYNVMIVAEAVMKATARLPKGLSYVAAALGIVAFVIAAGSGSSAVRAAIMACLSLFAKASGRTYSVLRALCLTIALMALWNPFTIAFDPSFQLSALATFGLILGVPIVEPHLGWVRNALLRDALATTVAAECAVLPLLLWQTGNFSIVSVPANVLVSFIVPSAMASAAVAGFAGMLLPAFSPVFGLPAFALLWIIIRSAEYAASLPFAQLILPAFPFAAAFAAYVVMCWLALKAYRRKAKAALASASAARPLLLAAPAATAPIPARAAGDRYTPSN